MTFKRRSGSSWVDPSSIKRRSGSSWVGVQTIKRRSGGAWVTIWTAYTAVTASYSGNPTGNDFDPEPAPQSKTVYSGTVTAAGANGNGSYTFSWVRISGDSSIAVSNASAASVTFSATVFKNLEKNAMFRCTVSDGTSSATVDVSVNLSYWTDL